MPASSKFKLGIVRRGKKLSYGQVKQVQKIVSSNKKLKRHWVHIGDNFDTAKSLISLSSIVEGDGFDKRDSDKVLCKSLKVQWSISNSNTPTAQSCRVMIVRSISVQNLAVGDMPAYNATPDFDKYQVLYDEIIYLENSDVDPIQRFHFKSFQNRKVPHMVLTFNKADGDDIPDKNGLYFYVVGTLASGGAPVNGYSLLKYYDAN